MYGQFPPGCMVGTMKPGRKPLPCNGRLPKVVKGLPSKTRLLPKYFCIDKGVENWD